MVSAGLDTVPGNLIMCLAYLSSPHGQEIQKRAYADIMSVYPNNDAWERCLHEEKVPYITALYKEVLRYYTVIPICLPRTSIKDIEWNGATIPAGTTFYMNAYAADYDEDHFKNAKEFRPERYIDGTEKAEGTEHYGVRHPPPTSIDNNKTNPAAVRCRLSYVPWLPPRQPRALHGIPTYHPCF